MRVLGSIVVGAAVVGTIGLAAEFFGPMVFMPDSNQGPLIGVFETGPAGVVVGAIAGGMRRRGA